MERLQRMNGVDPGFYLLAVYSLVESLLKANYPHFQDHPSISFNSNLWGFKEYVRDREGRENPELRGLIPRMQRQKRLTDAVRHNFADFSPDEAVAGTENLLALCRGAQLGDESVLARMEEALSEWKDREMNEEAARQLRRVEAALAQMREKEQGYLEQIARAREQEQQAAHLEEELHRTARELAEAEEKKERDKEKIDRLRKDRNRIGLELQQLQQGEELQGEAEAYRRCFQRLSVYTATRKAYEQRLMHLSPEQQAALERIDFSRDFLLKGSAGTGKSFVLLKALEGALERGIPRQGAAVFLTFTRTLVKYSRYTSQLMGLAQ